MDIEIRVYSTTDGKKPFTEWLQELKDKQGKYEVLERIRRLRMGLFGVWKRLGKIYEMKINFGPGYRVYFGKEGNTIILLLIGGMKRTQKRDINKANGYWKDYLRRSK